MVGLVPNGMGRPALPAHLSARAALRGCDSLGGDRRKHTTGLPLPDRRHVLARGGCILLAGECPLGEPSRGVLRRVAVFAVLPVYAAAAGHSYRRSGNLERAPASSVG